jgi:hypothetical protein
MSHPPPYPPSPQPAPPPPRGASNVRASGPTPTNDARTAGPLVTAFPGGPATNHDMPAAQPPAVRGPSGEPAA